MTSKRRARHLRTLRIIRQVTTPVKVTRARTPTAMVMSTRLVTTSMTFLLRTGRSTPRFSSVLLGSPLFSPTSPPASPRDPNRPMTDTDDRGTPGTIRGRIVLPQPWAPPSGTQTSDPDIRSRQEGDRDESSDQVVPKRRACTRHHHDAGDNPADCPGVGDR